MQYILFFFAQKRQKVKRLGTLLGDSDDVAIDLNISEHRQVHTYNMRARPILTYLLSHKQKLIK